MIVPLHGSRSRQFGDLPSEWLFEHDWISDSLGWSYGINGNLAKAPRFNRLEEFKKEDYSLWSIHLHIDQVGFVWVNLDASENPTSWEEQCNGADTQERLGVFDMDEYHYDHSWSMDGPYNWKTLIDNYNEVETSPCPSTAQKEG